MKAHIDNGMEAGIIWVYGLDKVVDSIANDGESYEL